MAFMLDFRWDDVSANEEGKTEIHHQSHPIHRSVLRRHISTFEVYLHIHHLLPFSRHHHHNRDNY